MTDPLTTELAGELQMFLSLCEETFALATRESRALAGRTEYQPFDFFRERKELLFKLERVLIKLRNLRREWRQFYQNERGGSDEVKSLFQTIQGMVMKILLLDGENREAMLRRGLVPSTHLQSVAKQSNNYVAGLYRRHST